MKFTTRTEAKEFYKDVLFDAELEGNSVQVMNMLGRRDLFFLLTKLLGRIDVDNDWLFERCVEVQCDPNGMLDLWAREHYKSTIITFALTIQDILDSHSVDPIRWHKEITVGIFSHTRPIAKGFLTQIKTEFEDNELLKAIYPDVLYQFPKKEAKKWSSDQGIIVKRKSNPNASTVEAHGLVDGQPTSKHFDILVYDDVVTRESVTTGEQIKKVTDAWALSLNLAAHGGVKRYIGTRYHSNDTYAAIIKRRAAKKRIHPATENGEPEGNPVFLSREVLAEKRQEMGPYIFGSQMLQDPKADEVQGFKEEWMQYWLPNDWEMMNRYILVDPASKSKKDSDWTVMLVIGLHIDNNYYIIDGIRSRLNLTGRTIQLMKFHRKYRPLKVAYEEYGMHADIEHIEYVMVKENYRFKITPVGGKVSKNDRIRGLIPLYEYMRVFWPVRCLYVDHERKSQDLTLQHADEYESFPVSQYDDIKDCEARILSPELGAKFPELIHTTKGKSNPGVANHEYDLDKYNLGG
jgi:phage terminase large subunit-like protein